VIAIDMNILIYELRTVDVVFRRMKD